MAEDDEDVDMPEREQRIARRCTDLAMKQFVRAHPNVAMTCKQWNDLQSEIYSAVLGTLAAYLEVYSADRA